MVSNNPTVFEEKIKFDKRPQAKCPLMCEMSVCGEYVYNMYVKKIPSPHPLKAPPLVKRSMGLFKKPGALQNTHN